jgi:Mrr N-terminal domain
MSKTRRKNETVGWFGPILDAIRELGGSGTPSEVTDLVAISEHVPEVVLNAKDKEGGSRFYKQVAYARLYLAREGLIDRSQSNRGMWTLTKEGWSTKLSYDDSRRIFLEWVEYDRRVREAKSKGLNPEEVKHPKHEVIGGLRIDIGNNHNEVNEQSDDLSLSGGSFVIGGPEGGRRSVMVTVVERNPKNREACLNHWGYQCRVCGFDFGHEFGNDAKGYIHVHHHNLVAESGEIVTDPINDMSPLCPNCHAVAHLKRPPYRIEELKAMRASSKSRS